MFWRNMPSSACYPLHASFFLGLFFNPEEVWWHILPKCWLTFNRLQGIISQKTELCLINRKPKKHIFCMYVSLCLTYNVNSFTSLTNYINIVCVHCDLLTFLITFPQKFVLSWVEGNEKKKKDNFITDLIMDQQYKSWGTVQSRVITERETFYITMKVAHSHYWLLNEYGYF